MLIKEIIAFRYAIVSIIIQSNKLQWMQRRLFSSLYLLTNCKKKILEKEKKQKKTWKKT